MALSHYYTCTCVVILPADFKLCEFYEHKRMYITICICRGCTMMDAGRVFLFAIASVTCMYVYVLDLDVHNVCMLHTHTLYISFHGTLLV